MARKRSSSSSKRKGRNTVRSARGNKAAKSQANKAASPKFKSIGAAQASGKMPGAGV